MKNVTFYLKNNFILLTSNILIVFFFIGCNKDNPNIKILQSSKQANSVNSYQITTTGVALRVMSFNIKHGSGMDNVIDLNRTAQAITSQNPDIVALNEVDKNTTRSGSTVDQAATLASLTGMQYYSFGRAIYYSGGEYGNAILSKYPITVLQNLPIPGEEARAALFVNVDVSALYGTGKAVYFIATHLDAVNESNRIQSVTDIENYFKTLPFKPSIFAGDMNATPTTATITEIKKYWKLENLGQTLLTLPADVPTAQADYIFFRQATDWTMTSILVVNNSVASDHRPLFSTLELGATAPPAPPVNLALNKPVTVSSTSGTYVGPNAVDGNTATRWTSGGTATDWIYVDLGSQQSIKNVNLNWDVAFAKGYKIQISNDALTWTTVSTVKNGNGGFDDITFTPVSTRYVKMQGTQKGGTGTGYSLWEFQVF